jgi:hypothetical protein
MASRSPSSEKAGSRLTGPSWARWSSLVRLAFWGGDAQCGQCGSNEVRRAWTPLPPWKRALGLDPCRCEACGATFHVPRRAATADLYEDPVEEMPEELTLPAPPEVDLAALDKAMAKRLPRLPTSK